jgi:hypothetical protein
MNHDHLAEVLDSAAVPMSLFDDDFDSFLAERSKELIGIAERLANL